MDIVGPKIRQLREARGLRQRELAERAGMNPSNLSKLERGEYTWTKDNLGRISKALGVHLSVLFTDHPSIRLVDHLAETPHKTAIASEYFHVLNAIDVKLEDILHEVRQASQWNGEERRRSA